jgi:hypothetical protein
MHIFDFLRRIFPAAIPPAEPAIKPLRKPRAKKPTIRKSRIVAAKKKPAPKKK